MWEDNKDINHASINLKHYRDRLIVASKTIILILENLLLHQKSSNYLANHRMRVHIAELKAEKG